MWLIMIVCDHIIILITKSPLLKSSLYMLSHFRRENLLDDLVAVGEHLSTGWYGREGGEERSEPSEPPRPLETLEGSSVTAQGCDRDVEHTKVWDSDEQEEEDHGFVEGSGRQMKNGHKAATPAGGKMIVTAQGKFLFIFVTDFFRYNTMRERAQFYFKHFYLYSNLLFLFL